MAAIPVLGHDGHAEGAVALAHGGTSAKLGGGTISAYVQLATDKDASNRRPPVEMGIEVPSSVIKSLPAEDTAAIVDFSIQAHGTPFQ